MPDFVILQTTNNKINRLRHNFVYTNMPGFYDNFTGEKYPTMINVWHHSVRKVEK